MRRQLTFAMIATMLAAGCGDCAQHERRIVDLQDRLATQREATDRIAALGEVIGFTVGEGSLPDAEVLRVELARINASVLMPQIDGQPLTVQVVLHNLAMNVTDVRNVFSDLRATRARLRLEIESLRTRLAKAESKGK